MKIAHVVCRLSAWALALTLLFGSSLASAQTTCPQAKSGRKYKVKIDSAPPGATVYVGGKECGPTGVTPWAGTLPAGATTVLVELEGYMPATKPFTVKRARAVQELFVPLVKKADPPRIDVRADADKNLFGAQLYVDGELQGQVPMLVTVDPGRHQVEIRKDGFETLTQWITAKENDKITLSPALKEVTKAKYGTVVVEADVPDAEVYIDGNKHPDKTPAVISNVIEGIHVIEVKKEPLAPWKQTIQVKAQEQTKVRADVRAGSGNATVSVLSNVSNAKVFLDGREVGVVPVDLKDVKPGDHVIEVKAEGYAAREERVSVAAGATQVLKMDLNVDGGPNQGIIKVVSPVPEAEVFIDGASVGKVPQEKRAGAGEHFVVVKLAGYKTFEQKVRVEASQSITVSAELKAVGSLRVISTPQDAAVMVNGVEIGRTPMTAELEVGQNIVRIEKLGFVPTERNITIEGGKTETISAELPVAGPSEAEAASEQKSLSSLGARTLPRGRSTVDMMAGYPYYLEGRINVGAGKIQQFGFDAGVGVRTLLERFELGLGVRFQLADQNPFSAGAFADLWWGSALLDDSKRNGVTFNVGAIASLTAMTGVTISGRVYGNFWSDRHCPELLSNMRFDGEPTDTCEGYLSRAVNGQTPNDFNEEDRTRAEFLTGNKGEEFFDRDAGARLMVSVAAEVALYQRWNLMGVLEIAPFQDERALFTNLFSRTMAETDPGIYVRLGTSYKF